MFIIRASKRAARAARLRKLGFMLRQFVLSQSQLSKEKTLETIPSLFQHFFTIIFYNFYPDH
jgi:hypothetical protein